MTRRRRSSGPPGGTNDLPTSDFRQPRPLPFGARLRARTRGPGSHGQPDPENGRKVFLPVAGLPVGKEVEVELDEPFEGNGVVSLPVRWKATWPSAAYPSFDGELELTRMIDGSAELWLLGAYRPPFGAIGRALDRAILHTLANDTVRHLLDSMASRLQHPAKAA